MHKYPVGTILITEPRATDGKYHIGVVILVDKYGRCQVKWNETKYSNFYNVTDMDRFFKKV